MSDLIETLELMCGQNEIQEVPRSFLVDLRGEIERLTATVALMADANEVSMERIAALEADLDKYKTGAWSNPYSEVEE